MKKKIDKTTQIDCPECKRLIIFNQPYPFHAGSGNQGFLYNESGNCTLVWSSFDPDYEKLVGQMHPWSLTEEIFSSYTKGIKKNSHEMLHEQA